MASAAGGDPPLPSIMNMFSGIENLTVNDGKFTQVIGDYHVHGNVDTMHADSLNGGSKADHDTSMNEMGRKTTFNTAGGIQVGRDYHHHVHLHYRAGGRRDDSSAFSETIRIERSTCLPRDPHYHVFRGGDIMFCTKFSPIYCQKNFPVNPSYEAMKKYATIVLDEIDAGLYRDMGYRRPGYFRRYLPREYYNGTPWLKYNARLGFQPDPTPKYNLKDYIPPFYFHTSEDDKENIYMFPCMQAHAAAARKSSASATPSPREALFSHLDRSGVK